MKTTTTVVTVLAAATAVSAIPAPTPAADNAQAKERAEAAGAHDAFDAGPTPAPSEEDKRYYAWDCAPYNTGTGINGGPPECTQCAIM
ncbi:hypothetical protein Q8F55_004046 [Vanrija albida]|uniref:Uncharacterized protein n=1 Tax=Vanrija albida TaxID=181172 RepID=A0ABR3Q5P2_9TREE